jgi:hypothetical protein
LRNMHASNPVSGTGIHTLPHSFVIVMSGNNELVSS